jgi:hypothetical protein
MRSRTQAQRVFALLNTLTSGLPIDVGHSASSQITEGRSPRFRAGALNLRHKTNFAAVSGTDAGAGGFGVFNATFPARQIQLALNLVF